MNHAQPVAHKDTQDLFHKAVLQPLTCVCSSRRTSRLASVELQEVTAGALLQLVEVPVNDSIVLNHTNDCAMFSVNCRFGKCALHPVTRVTNEDGKEHRPCCQSLGNAITNHLPVRLWKVDHYSSKQIVCPASNLLCTPFIQPLPHHLTTMILWEIIMKVFLKSENYNTVFPKPVVSPQR